MLRSDEQWLELTDSFHAAAFGAQSWDAALQGLARATGSRSAQLVGVDSRSSLAFNIITNVDPGVPKFIAETLDINPRAHAARYAPLLKPMADGDFMSLEEWRRNSFYQEYCCPYDVPFVCLATLERQASRFIILAVVRSLREGHIGAEQRDIFASLAPHVRAAVRTEVALARQGVSLLTGAFEALSIPLFVCDRSGKVGHLTPSAEVLLASGRGLQLQNGYLRATDHRENQTLESAVRAVANADTKPGAPAARTVVVHRQEFAPVVLDVFTLPARRHWSAFADSPSQALVVVRNATCGSEARRTAVLSAVYQLTAAETEIALRIAEGRSAAAIAESRAVAIGTVRLQIKCILAKLGIRRQVELAARLNQI